MRSRLRMLADSTRLPIRKSTTRGIHTRTMVHAQAGGEGREIGGVDLRAVLSCREGKRSEVYTTLHYTAILKSGLYGLGLCT